MMTERRIIKAKTSYSYLQYKRIIVVRFSISCIRLLWCHTPKHQ